MIGLNVFDIYMGPYLEGLVDSFASEQAKGMTGQTMIIDGGYTAQ